MRFSKLALFSRSKKVAPVIRKASVGFWCYQSRTQPYRLVRKVELCTALAPGGDVWDEPVAEDHFHTFLRVFTIPHPSVAGGSEDVILIERVLATEDAYHAVTPIPENVTLDGTPLYPEANDRVCVAPESYLNSLADQVEVERTLEFSTSIGSPELLLTLAQFAQILSFVSRTTAPLFRLGECDLQARLLAFNVMAALTPKLPPRSVATKRHSHPRSDAIFEEGAEMFLQHISQLVCSADSVRTLKLIAIFKGEDYAKAIENPED